MPRDLLKGAVFNSTDGAQLKGAEAEKAVARTMPESERITYYTINGRGDYKNEAGNDVLLDADDNHREACSKKVVRDGKTKCFIKRDSRGMFYNPVGLYATTANEQRSRQGGDKYSYVEVNPTCFKLYLSFLRTKQARFLHQAERESY